MSSNSLNYLILIISAFAAATIITLVFRKLLNTLIVKNADTIKANPTNFFFLKNSVGVIAYLGAIIFIFYKIPYLHSIGTALFAGAGVFALVVGLAAQKAFANVVSGLFILMFKPFRVNDIIQLSNLQMGIVEEITLRHTVIRDFENRRIIIPNSIVGDETITNSSIQDEKIKKHIVFGISYDSDVNKAMDIIRDEALKHPNTIDNRTRQEKKDGVEVVPLKVVRLGDFSVDIKAWIWTETNGHAFELQCDLLKSVKERFDKEGIEIPFPYRTIVHKNKPQSWSITAENELSLIAMYLRE